MNYEKSIETFKSCTIVIDTSYIFLSRLISKLFLRGVYELYDISKITAHQINNTYNKSKLSENLLCT